MTIITEEPWFQINLALLKHLQSVIESELLDNLKVYDFELSADEMAIIDQLDKNMRKIIPINKLKSGETVIRDARSRHYPFNYREPME